MPAVQERSDAADRCSPGGRRNRWMEQLMSDAISYASAGPGFPVAQVRAEVCLDPVSAAQGTSASLRRCRFPRLHVIAKHILRASPISFLPIADILPVSSPIL